MFSTSKGTGALHANALILDIERKKLYSFSFFCVWQSLHTLVHAFAYLLKATRRAHIREKDFLNSVRSDFKRCCSVLNWDMNIT